MFFKLDKHQHYIQFCFIKMHMQHKTNINRVIKAVGIQLALLSVNSVCLLSHVQREESEIVKNIYIYILSSTNVNIIEQKSHLFEMLP